MPQPAVYVEQVQRGQDFQIVMNITNYAEAHRHLSKSKCSLERKRRLQQLQANYAVPHPAAHVRRCKSVEVLRLAKRVSVDQGGKDYPHASSQARVQALTALQWGLPQRAPARSPSGSC